MKLRVESCRSTSECGKLERARRRRWRNNPISCLGAFFPAPAFSGKGSGVRVWREGSKARLARALRGRRGTRVRAAGRKAVSLTGPVQGSVPIRRTTSSASAFERPKVMRYSTTLPFSGRKILPACTTPKGAG